MRGLTKALMAAIAALIIGFGAGEVFGPQDLAAGGGECSYTMCFVGHFGDECRPTDEARDCLLNHLGSCYTETCDIEEDCDEADGGLECDPI